ncbi:MAG: hypothetical protein OFPI_37210 [Osedax symbiont Rs2]|nr:MAG: hypothetical protein OFPI_37210 [Osedax symbiont Rs2]
MQPDKQTEKENPAAQKSSLVAAYNRIVQRMTKSGLKTADNSTALLREIVDEAIALEQAAVQMSSEEMHLLARYVYRDMTLLAFYLHETERGLASWLNFDLAILEQSVKEQFVHLADQTIIENLALREKLDCSSVQYLSGEVCTLGTLRCLNCGTQQQMLKTEVILPCKECASDCFERSSK